ncbi:hypothetical protein VaNZ11_005886 [Volvox africanus]|uniref:PDEase domain-containing protein n=1 Tax=Volvox africanus TaxID=51714 RepID=A0ABQ5S045_9CHLO|nr:hypothetical protein VaNZ11_005886 [Volvox africanus]
MDLQLGLCRTHILNEEDRQYFHHFCGRTEYLHGADVNRWKEYDQIPSCKATVVDGERVGPWWRRWAAHKDAGNQSKVGGSESNVAASLQQMTPATSLCGGGTQSSMGQRLRVDPGEMQEAVMKDLLQAKKTSSGKADTPAALLLSMLSDLLLGREPDLGDAAMARGLLLRHTDPYQPLNLHRQMQEANLDIDVVNALMHQLGASATPPSIPPDDQARNCPGEPTPPETSCDRGGGGGDAGSCDRTAAYIDADANAVAVASAGGPAASSDSELLATTEDSFSGMLALLMKPSAATAAAVGFPSRASEGGTSGSGSCSSGGDSDGGLQVYEYRQTVSPPVLEEVERFLAKAADAWQYDTWKLAEMTQGHALSCLGFYLLHREGLISQFRIQPTKLARLLRTLESGYPSNPYHNSTHAADVLQTLHMLVRGAGLTPHYLDPLGLMAAYFAAIIHDHGHPGLTSDFLISTSDPLAVRYNDRSPLENHHGASFFALMQQPGMNVMGQLTGQERAAFRKQVLDLVMATDMKQHFSLLAHFNTAHHLAAYNKDIGPWGLARTAAAKLSRCSRNDTEAAGSGLDVVGAGVAGGEGLPGEMPRPLDETERTLSLQIFLKAADLGHLGEELGVHQRWVRSLEEEFFLQGDREQQLGFPISPLFDRSKQGVSKSQVGFYDFIALPLAHSLASAFPGAKPLLACFVDNYEHWRAAERAAVAAAAAAAQ